MFLDAKTPGVISLKNHVKKKTLELLESKGLHDWSVKFSHSADYAGRCEYDLKIIIYSLPFLMVSDDKIIRNTVFHEVSHAIVGINGHTEQWRKTHLSLGGNGKKETVVPQVLITHDFFEWVGVCCLCGHKCGFHYEPDGVWACRNCCPSKGEQNVFVFSKRM